jgi:hypothetical protein
MQDETKSNAANSTNATNANAVRSKLKQRMHAERLKRNTGMAQRTFLEKKKVPTDLIDNCMAQIKQKKPLAQALQQMMNMPQMEMMQEMLTNPDGRSSAALTEMLASVAKSSPGQSQALMDILQKASETLVKKESKE